MADKDDIESKLRRAGDDAKDALAHASGAAIEAARGAVDKAPEIKERLTEAAGRAKERAARGVQESGGRLQETADSASSAVTPVYGQASDTAQHGYELASARVASAPMGSVLVASMIGILIGWAWRGSVEAEKRSAMLYRLPRYWRDRLDL
jgi:hypothetical protein